MKTKGLTWKVESVDFGAGGLHSMYERPHFNVQLTGFPEDNFVFTGRISDIAQDLQEKLVDYDPRARRKDVLNALTRDLAALFNCGIPSIKKVIFNEPATIVIWSDGSKTVVKAQNGEEYDPEKGLTMAITKRVFGNKGNYYEQIKKWLPKEEETNQIIIDFKCTNNISKAIKSYRKLY